MFYKYFDIFYPSSIILSTPAETNSYRGIIFIHGCQCSWVTKIFLVRGVVISLVASSISWINVTQTLVYMYMFVRSKFVGKGYPQKPWTLVHHKQWWLHSKSWLYRTTIQTDTLILTRLFIDWSKPTGYSDLPKITDRTK